MGQQESLLFCLEVILEEPERVDDISSGLLTLREAAKVLNVSKSTIERRIKSGDISAIKLGYLTRVPKISVRNYEQSRPPAVYR
jgi:excisionase family DNA binding protein